jgi:hypothetical protein
MSYLFRPRVHFLGGFGVSTPTANNNNYILALDPEKIGFFSPYDTMDDQQFRDEMRKLVQIDFNGFFGLGVEQILQGNWNYYGDNRITLNGVSVFAIDSADGSRLTLPSQDPLIGAPVQMLGNNFGDTPTPAIMVDSDPTSDLATQIFTSSFTVGQPGCMLSAQATPASPLPRAFSRWIYLFYRNLVETPDATFSAIWQHALPNANISFDAGNSPTLAALRQIAAQGRGLQVRYVTYFFRRKFTDPQMAQFFQQGNFQLNESAGIMLGTIGPWDAGEPGTWPAARLLVPPMSTMTYGTGTTAKQYTLGPALAVLDTSRNVLVLDLINTFPETTSDPNSNPQNLTKIDLGVATLQAVAAGGAVTTVGTFAYDTTTYLAGGGIVEIPVAPGIVNTLASCELRIVCAAAASAPVTVLAEQSAVVETDDHCVYITEGHSVTVNLQAWLKGQAPPGMQIQVQQYRTKESLQSLNPSQPNAAKIPAKNSILTPNPSGFPPPFLSYPSSTLTVDANGMVDLTLTGVEPGVGMIRLVPAGSNPPDPKGMADWMRLFYINVRVLPADSQFDSVPDSALTWDFIYANVLRYFYRLYPAMDSHVPLNNQQAVTNAAPMLRMMIDPSKWNSTLYMPVTRELSDGKRRLLQRWLNLL